MEATRTGVRPAEWWERLAARLIEGLAFGVFYYILFIALWVSFRTVGAPELSAGRLAGAVAWFTAGLAYTAYEWEALCGAGRTFGKAIMKIQVTPDDLPRRALLKRALLYPGPVMLLGIPLVNLLAGIFLFAVGMLILIDRPAQRGPHDRLAGTRVVKDLR
ncbi:RDD family protein [Nonomuraea rhodomycinica]|uniref:RDD family protein n=1 Tax=Nonomuraea rhodomycinica TaxID=1712872 RepID=A0A7Y6ISQ1_9ACTN|nr:RDD family protein [Nonomuraea rhodomycinica]NUW43724.1 RDD family protein [Nonomuraea rhodomycinica]